MRCLQRGKWVGSSLDYHREAREYRIRVLAFANLERLTNLYFVRPRSARLLWNYLSQVGPVDVWRKVASRLQERFRNEKYVSLGWGEILESPAGGRHDLGERVLFVAPGLPACVERVVLPEALIAAAEDLVPPVASSPEILYLPLGAGVLPSGDWWETVRRWDSQSGFELGDEDATAIEAGLAEIARKLDWSGARRLPMSAEAAITEFRAGRTVRTHSRRKRAVLFGYGHYAKTNILPNVGRFIGVDRVHEVDPTQIPLDRGGIASWDTSPHPGPADDHDVFLIAGYHHTHAPLAVAALRRGAYAVVEKPVAVSRDQLTDLMAAVADAPAGFFACFHKRYSPLNDFALYDLGQPPGAPIDYHCIVYEVPLPELHWYRWPNSRSRLVSNGCHWLDHFLYVNGFCAVRSFDLGASPSGVIHCSVTLENGAYFTMVLTDKGSERIGLQEYVELRAGEVTVKIVNNARYMAEDRDRVIRRARINKMLPYKRMYRRIAEQISRGEGGDTLQSLRVSAGLVLDLEARLEQIDTARARAPENTATGAG